MSETETLETAAREGVVLASLIEYEISRAVQDQVKVLCADIPASQHATLALAHSMVVMTHLMGTLHGRVEVLRRTFIEVDQRPLLALLEKLEALNVVNAQKNVDITFETPAVQTALQQMRRSMGGGMN